MTEYSATTTNDTNKVTATPEEGATVVIKLNGTTTVESGTSATWTAGENELEITVTHAEEGRETATKVYTVAVTKTSPEPDPEQGDGPGA